VPVLPREEFEKLDP